MTTPADRPNSGIPAPAEPGQTPAEPTPPAEAIGYLRVSTGRQTESGLGIEAQTSTIETWATYKQLRVDWIQDEAVSGTTAPDQRPGLSQALTRLENPADPAQTLITAKLDRLGRDTRDILNLAERARTNNWRLVLLDIDIDSSTPAGGLMLTVMAAIAEFERRIISERTRRALAQLKAQGKTLGRPDKTPPQATTRIHELRNAGHTYQQIADQLNTEQIPTSTGEGKWQPTMTRRVALRAETADYPPPHRTGQHPPVRSNKGNTRPPPPGEPPPWGRNRSTPAAGTRQPPYFDRSSYSDIALLSPGP